MEVAPIVITCMATRHKLLESALKVKDSKYFLEISSLGALNEARVITGSRLGCSYSCDRVDEGVEGMAEKVLALL
ncbi:hypothetical protein PS1_019793 [Malus domestica]